MRQQIVFGSPRALKIAKSNLEIAERAKRIAMQYEVSTDSIALDLLIKRERLLDAIKKCDAKAKAWGSVPNYKKECLWLEKGHVLTERLYSLDDKLHYFYGIKRQFLS